MLDSKKVFDEAGRVKKELKRVRDSKIPFF